MDNDSALEARLRSLIPAGELLPEGMVRGGAEEVARDLLGCFLVSTVDGELVGGRIVETEAYLGGDDPASHAAGRVGRTSRNAPMFGPSGTAYVYLVYGMHWCLNVVTGVVGDPQAVLLRAIEPCLGDETMRVRRGRDQDLTNGPARLAKALGIDGSLNGHHFDGHPLFLFAGARPDEHAVGVSGRIGVRHARDWPLRFFLMGHPDVSRGRPNPASS
jgi:DNA-3-methyladenine glycosylase